jgi:hypothetical protein
MAFGDSIGLLFTLKAKDEASQVVARASSNIGGEVKALDTVVGKLGQQFGLSHSQIASFSKALPIAGAAAGALGAAVIGAGAALFTLAKNASDAGSEIFDLKAKTGLGAESLSALKFAADQSASSSIRTS